MCKIETNTLIEKGIKEVEIKEVDNLKHFLLFETLYYINSNNISIDINKVIDNIDNLILDYPLHQQITESIFYYLDSINDMD